MLVGFSTKNVPMSELETNLFTKPISKEKHKNKVSLKKLAVVLTSNQINQKSGRKYSLLPATEPHEGRVDQIKRASIHDVSHTFIL